MKLKSAVKYRYSKVFRISLVFYALMLVLVIGSFILKAATKSDISIEKYFAYIMFGFTAALGLSSYTGELNLFLQNGVSRQTAHKSFLALLPVNAVFAIISVLIDYLFYRVNKKAEYCCTHYLSIKFRLPQSTVGQILTDIFIVTLCYLLTMCIGYMICSVAHSMKKFLKIVFGAITVSFAVLCFAALSYIQGSGWFSNLLIIIRSIFLGVNNTVIKSSVFNFFVEVCMIIIVCISVSHLVIGRAAVKKGVDGK